MANKTAAKKVDLEERIQPNFQMKEFLHSETAQSLGIDLTNPPEDIVKNILKVAPKAQRAREIWGVPTVVSSCWRPDAVNDAIPGRPKGKSKGAHPEALAVDLIPQGMGLRDAYNALIKDPDFMMDVDQLIIERGCIHVGMACSCTNFAIRHELRTEVYVNNERHYNLTGHWTETGVVLV